MTPDAQIRAQRLLQDGTAPQLLRQHHACPYLLAHGQTTRERAETLRLLRTYRRLGPAGGPPRRGGEER